jgi:dolichyl-phosphate beta-glucosyltransferase
MDVSIVIPAFNEASKIGRDVEAASEFLAGSGLHGEVIVVDDGSSDGTSGAAAAPDIPPAVERRILRLEKNSGKGAAVRQGILHSRGQVVIYADSGTCIPYSNALSVISKIAAGRLDLALASRRLKETVIRRKQPLRRRIIGRIFRRAAILVAGLPTWVTDSQCGFKAYRGEIAKELFSDLKISGFLFELEIILKAVRRGLRVEEFPVEWTCDLDTRLKPSRQAVTVLKELLQVRDAAKEEES